MKKLIAIIISASLLAACGNPASFKIEDKVKKYPTYGFFNSDTQKSEKICYEVSVGNVVWSIILVQTIVAPVYFIGFSLFNPVTIKNVDGTCPGIDS
ncbi:MAG: hypothetical protein CO120_09845 [Gammaproteobacteria bacterium CG_4_9_14_3_um_filter_38_9]|nr:MAG: hypothetical protein CO120_09845 [Gammaproteobacteria bacterium CG_4_9_14_3_um_filter_38_9]